MIIVKTANKSLQKTQTALNSFSIIARHKGFSGIIGFLLPVRMHFALLSSGVPPTVDCSNKGIILAG